MRSRRRLALLASLVGLLACESGERPAANPPLTLERVPMPGNRQLPFSAAVRVGPMLYLSGQLGTDSTGRLVAGNRTRDGAGAGQRERVAGRARVRDGSGRQVHGHARRHGGMARDERGVRPAFPRRVPRAERLRHQRARPGCAGGAGVSRPCRRRLRPPVASARFLAWEGQPSLTRVPAPCRLRRPAAPPEIRGANGYQTRQDHQA